MSSPDFRKAGQQTITLAGRPALITYSGQCVVCHTRIYNGMGAAYLDHSDCSLEASDYNMTGADIPLCFNCSNNEPRYLRAMGIANKRWGK